MEIRENDLIFAKTKENAIIPTKRLEDAGYDIYTCEIETIVIPPCSTRMIDTGIAIACHHTYFPKFFDKGGMGSKGIIVSSGVGDSGFRDSYFVSLVNTNKSEWLIITNQDQNEIENCNYFSITENCFIKLEDINRYLIGVDYIAKEDCIVKPLKKAIAQFVMIPVPQLNTKEVTWGELRSIISERGLGKLGSSGK